MRNKCTFAGVHPRYRGIRWVCKGMMIISAVLVLRMSRTVVVLFIPANIT